MFEIYSNSDPSFYHHKVGSSSKNAVPPLHGAVTPCLVDSMHRRNYSPFHPPALLPPPPRGRWRGTSEGAGNFWRKEGSPRPSPPPTQPGFVSWFVLSQSFFSSYLSLAMGNPEPGRSGPRPQGSAFRRDNKTKSWADSDTQTRGPDIPSHVCLFIFSIELRKSELRTLSAVLPGHRRLHCHH